MIHDNYRVKIKRGDNFSDRLTDWQNISLAGYNRDGDIDGTVTTTIKGLKL